MKKIEGFKAFNKGLITNQGDKLKLNKIYEIKGTPIFRRKGYHICENLEDTLRFFDCENIDICRVIGYPEYAVYWDDYNESGKMYSCQKIQLTHILTEKEIIEEAKKMNQFRFYTFSAFYPLKEEQIKYFLEKYIDNNWILSNLIYRYYDEEIFERKIKENVNYKEMAKQYIKK